MILEKKTFKMFVFKNNNNKFKRIIYRGNLNVLPSKSTENLFIFYFYGVDFTYNTFIILNYLI